MKKKRLIAGNWKMNYTAKEAEAFILSMKNELKAVKKAEVALCVPFTALFAAKKAVKGTRVKLGAQSVSWAEKGAFTGEISPAMLLEAGAGYAVVGHSERRQYFGETDTTVNKRALNALKHGIRPIICVGETEQERAVEQTEMVLAAQTKAALKDITPEMFASVVIAYEPVWAIGTGLNATPQQAADAIKFIRKIAAGLYGRAAANALRILYGGSMNRKNCAELLAMKEIDGGLIGGASLVKEDFLAIIEASYS